MGYKFESLDTSILVRITTRDDEKLVKRISEYLCERPDKKFFVDDVAFSELVYVLERQKHISRDGIAKILNFFLNGYPFVTNMLIDKVLPFYVKHPKLSFNDCYLAFKAEENNAVPLWTLDQKLGKQADTAKMF